VSATITFKAKAQELANADGSIAYRFVSVPQFTRSHCDMQAFRNHPKFGGYANSDLFPAMLARIRREIVSGGLGLRLDQLPDNVQANEKGLLTEIKITV
jgi:hypothetical protein